MGNRGLAIAVILFFATLGTATADTDIPKTDDVLFVVTKDEIPDKRLNGVRTYLSVDRINNYIVSERPREFDEIKHVVVKHDFLEKLPFGDSSALKDFLRNAVKDGKKVWFVGSDIPDNFQQFYLGIESWTKTYRGGHKEYSLAKGVWKETNKKGYVFSNFSSSGLLSLEEIIEQLRKK